MTNDVRREAWIAELANPAVPISKLSRSVPHGYKGEKLLAMLVEKQVPVGRAVWYIRTNGATEIVSPRCVAPHRGWRIADPSWPRSKHNAHARGSR